MDKEEIMRSGLTLTPGRQAAPTAPAAPAAGSDRDILEIGQRWRAGGYAGSVAQEEMEYVLRLAGGGEDPQERYLANLILSQHYIVQGDDKRGMYYLRSALPFADTHATAALVYLQMMALQPTGEEKLPYYDKAAVECLQGIREEEREAIDMVLQGRLEEGDYALRAAASRAWSTHPENTDPFEREEAESGCYQYLAAYQKQKSKGFSEAIYSPLSGERKNELRWRVRLRETFLARGEVIPPDEKGYAPAAQTPPGPQAAGRPPRSSAEQERADTLMKTVRAFGHRYTGRSGQLNYARNTALAAYVDMAEPIVRELMRGNAALMRGLIDAPGVFEAMQDYALLGTAASLLLFHPSCTDGRERIVVQKKCVFWTETSVSLAEACRDRQPLEQRLLEENIEPQGSTYRKLWAELFFHTRDVVQKKS